MYVVSHSRGGIFWRRNFLCVTVFLCCLFILPAISDLLAFCLVGGMGVGGSNSKGRVGNKFFWLTSRVALAFFRALYAHEFRKGFFWGSDVENAEAFGFASG